MSPYIKRLQKETGIQGKQTATAWNNALDIAEEMFGKQLEDFGKEEFEYAYQVALEDIRKQEIKYSLANFVESGAKACDYIEMVVSGDFSLNSTMQRLGDDDDDDDDEEDVYFEGCKGKEKEKDKEGDDLEPEEKKKSEYKEEDDFDSLNQRVIERLKKEYKSTKLNKEVVADDSIDITAIDEIPLEKE
jgi:hypothetical protein